MAADAWRWGVGLLVLLLFASMLAWLTATSSCPAYLVPFLLGSHVSEEELGRVPSPSGDVEAVVVQTNGGATTSFGYQIILVAAGAEPAGGASAAYLYGATRNARTYGLNPRWISDHVLRIEYFQARSARVHDPGRFVINGRLITVASQAGVDDPSACPTGLPKVDGRDCDAGGD